jgi:tetratricopeptide (TPR) repeat protein
VSSFFFQKTAKLQHRYRGEKEKAADCAARAGTVMSSHGHEDDGRRFQRRAKRLRAGEPLNRIVVHVGGQVLELEEVTHVGDRQYKLVFERNRIKLHLASGLCKTAVQMAQRGERDQALKWSRKASQVDPHDPDPWYQGGVCLLELTRYAEAGQSFRTVEELAPGWFHCRTDAWIADQLLTGGMDHEDFQALRLLEDGGLPAARRVSIAEAAIQKNTELAPLWLVKGDSLAKCRRESEAHSAYRLGLKCAKEPDVKTRLLFALSTVCPDDDERIQLLNEAIQLNGNLVAAASARLSLIPLQR